ncbi:MAG: hypothetical protein CSA44_02175 [Gammaproteobacteria bacterium]|nr:MAG: hypothetical protein CSA44_02175 [Gammaproteobacteria bacterium]
MNKIRGLIIVGTVIALFLALFFFVEFTGFLFDIQQQYADSPQWLIAFYLVGVALIALVGLVLIYKVSRLGTSPKKVVDSQPREVVDDETFTQKISELRDKGANTDAIESDWQNLLSIREKEAVTIALFGEINAGKSALIQTLTGMKTGVSARAGKTRVITNYPFTIGQRRYELIDMPGLSEVDAGITDELVREKAIKSHLVIWVVDEEITRSSHAHYQTLKRFGKPVIIAINKADYYSDTERQQIAERIREQLADNLPIVWVSAATTKTVEKHYDDGRIESQEIAVTGQVGDLIAVIESLTFDRLTLDYRLNDSYFQSLEIQMNKSLSDVRRLKAENVVKSYTKKAVFAGMAAVGPGTDVLLQGYLGMGMTKALCDIYDVEVKSVDLEATLAMLNDKMKKELALILALVGNVLKAFPGIGTVTGGIAHAVAYGLIFESLGKAMSACLDSHQGLEQHRLVSALEEQLHDNLEKRAFNMAKAVIFKR